MTTLLEAAKQALEALEDVDGIDTETECVTIDVGEAITAIREALAQPDPAVQGKPGAIHQFRVQGCSDWYDGHPDYSDGTNAYETRTLYTTPQPAMKELTAYDRYEERNRAAFEQVLFQAQTAAIVLARKVKVYEDALGEIAWSNNSEWQQDRAKQVLAKMRGVEL